MKFRKSSNGLCTIITNYIRNAYTQNTRVENSKNKYFQRQERRTKPSRICVASSDDFITPSSLPHSPLRVCRKKENPRKYNTIVKCKIVLRNS